MLLVYTCASCASCQAPGKLSIGRNDEAWSMYSRSTLIQGQLHEGAAPSVSGFGHFPNLRPPYYFVLVFHIFVLFNLCSIYYFITHISIINPLQIDIPAQPQTKTPCTSAHRTIMSLTLGCLAITTFCYINFLQIAEVLASNKIVGDAAYIHFNIQERYNQFCGF